MRRMPRGQRFDERSLDAPTRMLARIHDSPVDIECVHTLEPTKLSLHRCRRPVQELSERAERDRECATQLEQCIELCTQRAAPFERFQALHEPSFATPVQ